MNKVEFVVQGKDGRWKTKECFISGKVEVNFSIKKPAVDIALQKRTGLSRLAF